MAAYINLQLNLVFSCNLFFSMGLVVGVFMVKPSVFYHVGGDLNETYPNCPVELVSKLQNLFLSYKNYS